MNNDMNNQSNIERVVMQRVHLIRALRVALSSGVLSTLVSVLALFGIGREVWVVRILQNAPVSLLNIPQFYFSAFVHTHFIVQALIVLMLASLLYVAYEVARAVAVMSASESV